jgi:lipid A oxidase
MLAKLLRTAGLVHLVLGALLAVVLLFPASVERYGDRLQVALPMIAWGCAATSGDGRELFIRFAAMFTIMHSSKIALGDAPINQRPNGGTKGFPSGHTAAAAFGASSLVNDCLTKNPVARTIVIFAAAFVGGSRIAVDKHDIWQVFAGGALGVAADRALRRENPARQRVLLVLRGMNSFAGWAAGGVYAVWALLTRHPRLLNRLRKAGLATSIILVFMGLTFATAARAEVEVSLYGGYQTAPHSTIRSDTLGDDFVRWEGRSFEMPPYYGVRATWWRSPTFGWGLEFNHAKVYADDPESYGYAQLEMTDGLNLLTANIWRRWPGEGPWTPYVGAGLGLAVPHVEVQPTGQTETVGYQITGPAMQVVAGASYRLNDRWSLFGEYKASYSKHRIDLDSGGTLSTDIVTNALNLGASIRF